MIDEPEEEPIDGEAMRNHANEELGRQLQTTVRYAMKQGLTETEVRRKVEHVLNENRRR